jgi:hypothetical protein
MLTWPTWCGHACFKGWGKEAALCLLLLRPHVGSSRKRIWICIDLILIVPQCGEYICHEFVSVSYSISGTVLFARFNTWSNCKYDFIEAVCARWRLTVCCLLKAKLWSTFKTAPGSHNKVLWRRCQTLNWRLHSDWDIWWKWWFQVYSGPIWNCLSQIYSICFLASKLNHNNMHLVEPSFVARISWWRKPMIVLGNARRCRYRVQRQHQDLAVLRRFGVNTWTLGTSMSLLYAAVPQIPVATIFIQTTIVIGDW